MYHTVLLYLFQSSSEFKHIALLPEPFFQQLFQSSSEFKAIIFNILAGFIPETFNPLLSLSSDYVKYFGDDVSNFQSSSEFKLRTGSFGVHPTSSSFNPLLSLRFL